MPTVEVDSYRGACHRELGSELSSNYYSDALRDICMMRATKCAHADTTRNRDGPLQSACMLFRILDLPVELRLQIFEYAVQEERALFPQQITEGSNKFTWSTRESIPAFNHPGCNDYIWAPKKDERLTVTSLQLTCKKFYHELESTPKFYRVNEFRFTQDSIVPYLAAIKPKRRNAIRHISMYPSPKYCSYGSLAPILSGGRNLDRHILPILSRCHDLRDFAFLLSFSQNADMKMTRPEDRSDPLAAIRRCERLARAPTDGASLWDLPGFSIKVMVGKVDVADTDEDIDIQDHPLALDCTWRHWAQTAEVADAVHSLQEAVAARNAVKFVDLRNVFTEEDFQIAVESAGLDFPGQYRGSLERDPVRRGPIARRTRKQTVPDSQHNRHGTMKLQLLPRHDAEGHLLWRIKEINVIRRTDAGADCHVVWRIPGTDPSAWEDISAMFTGEGIELIRQFYETQNRFASIALTHSQRDVRTWLGILDSTLAPKEVQVMAGDLFDNKCLCATWRALQRSFNRRMTDLRSRIRGFEKEALRKRKADSPSMSVAKRMRG